MENSGQVEKVGQQMHDMVRLLFPICRSLTGAGVRQTLSLIKEKHPTLQIHDVPSGTLAFDWTVPNEWNIRDAWVKGPDGKKIIDFSSSNLHVMGYSEPVKKHCSLEELKQHLYSLPEQPDAIPYVTSYYKSRWGFCAAHRLVEGLQPGQYEVCIDSELRPGVMNYGELYIPGESESEILLSTYICHPSMANNELSGPVLACFIADWIKTKPRRYSYRILFSPETIGSIYYLSRNYRELQEKMIAGFVLTCVGDERTFSYLPSRKGNTLSDRVAQHVLKHIFPDYMRYSFLDRGSDERQYCSAGIDLPVCSIMRTKYGAYPEYHTSLDDLSLVTARGLGGSLDVYCKCISLLESNEFLSSCTLCEPQLGKRGLYPTLSTKQTYAEVRNMMNLLAYADGSLDLIALADEIGVASWELYQLINTLKQESLLRSD